MSSTVDQNVHHAEAFCDTGDVATGGGYETEPGGAQISINRPLPFSPDGVIPHGWQAGTPATLTSPPGAATITAYVVCAKT
ncbi:hypothetical protein ACWEO4_12190 [Streptomyces sp. NPDC004393]|uniref:hypothetical protein n=1 Tax=Streptomyces sp. NPDC004533 TaxID=3154278 RepID=UPI0033B28DE7